MKRLALPLTLVGLVVAVLVGLAIGVPVGQNNPATPPTPTPTPVAPRWWPKGLPFSEGMLLSAADRFAPVAPSAPFTITVKTDGTNGKCEIVLEGHEYLPDYALSLEVMKNCNALSSKAIAAKKEVDLKKLDPAPIPNNIKTDPFGGCEVSGDSELARGCFNFSREGMANLHPALPDPFPPTLPLPVKIWSYVYDGADYYYLETEIPASGANVQLVTFKKLSGGEWRVRDVWIANDLVYKFCQVQVADGFIKITYNCSDDSKGPSRTWPLYEVFP